MNNMEDAQVKRLEVHEDSNSSSIAVLKEQIATVRRDMDTLMKDMREVRGLVTQSAISQAATASKMTCSAPNLCVELKQQVERLAVTVQSLAENRAEARGAMRMGVALASVFGTIGGAILTYALQHIKLP